VIFNLRVESPTEVVNHLWMGRQKIIHLHR